MEEASSRHVPAIHCAYDEMWEIGRLVPNPRNPNQHPMGQIELLAKVIRAQGWRAPITVSARSGFIVRGHGRLAAAIALGLDEAPVDIQQYASEAEEWADMIADNRIAELAEMDNLKLRDLLSELDTGAMEMDLTGYDNDELERIMSYVGYDHNEAKTTEQLPDLGISGEILSTGRFLVVYQNDEERNALLRLFGVEEGDERVVWTVDDIPALEMGKDAE